MTDGSKLCFATCSIGPPTHSLVDKLNAIRDAGFDSIELSMPDLIAFANALPGEKQEVGQDDFEELAGAAKEVKSLCVQRSLKIILLQPFANFEGWDRETPEWEDAWRRVRGWIKIMLCCDCSTLQVGSTDADRVIKDRSRIVSDLRMLAEELSKHNLRCAYENWCWSTHAPTWHDVWDICRQVDMPNFGLCLDTFQTAGSEWADPSWSDGLEQHPEGQVGLDKRLDESMARLAKTVPAEKIYLLQISDAYRAVPPIQASGSGAAPKPRAAWSQKYRPPPYAGGYLPVEKVTAAVRQTGFNGPFSMEVFEDKPGTQVSLRDYAELCAASIKKLLSQTDRGC